MNQLQADFVYFTISIFELKDTLRRIILQNLCICKDDLKYMVKYLNVLAFDVRQYINVYCTYIKYVIYSMQCVHLYTVYST